MLAIEQNTDWKDRFDILIAATYELKKLPLAVSASFIHGNEVIPDSSFDSSIMGTEWYGGGIIIFTKPLVRRGSIFGCLFDSSDFPHYAGPVLNRSDPRPKIDSIQICRPNLNWTKIADTLGNLKFFQPLNIKMLCNYL
jgi:hypothetical protein